MKSEIKGIGMAMCSSASVIVQRLALMASTPIADSDGNKAFLCQQQYTKHGTNGIPLPRNPVPAVRHLQSFPDTGSLMVNSQYILDMVCNFDPSIQYLGKSGLQTPCQITTSGEVWETPQIWDSCLASPHGAFWDDLCTQISLDCLREVTYPLVHACSIGIDKDRHNAI